MNLYIYCQLERKQNDLRERKIALKKVISSYFLLASTVCSKSSKRKINDMQWLRESKGELKVHYFQILWKSHYTMLQKLSKCEFKAGLCWNLIMLPPLKFYVKSNLGESKRSKNVIFGNFSDSELWIFGKLGLESCWNLLKIKI